MDRIERALELLIDDHIQFRDQHKALLTSQVLLTDKVDKLADELKALAQQTKERFAETAKRFVDPRNAPSIIVTGPRLRSIKPAALRPRSTRPPSVPPIRTSTIRFGSRFAASAIFR